MPKGKKNKKAKFADYPQKVIKVGYLVSIVKQL